MTDILTYFGYGALLLTIIVHPMLGYTVWINAAERERDQKPLMYLGSGGWALTTLLFGVFGLLTYWLIHHSALRKLYSKEEEAAGKGH